MTNKSTQNKLRHSFFPLVSPFLLLAFFFLLFSSCNTTEPPPIKNGPDTTSQNFTFETYEFGDGFSSSYFNDVWIFDENNIWVCGNVLTNDSTDGNLYHWGGNKWNAIRTNYVDMEGIWGIDSILYLASGGIWRYDRTNLVRQPFKFTLSNGQAVHRLWGSSESNIWGVGPWGTIVHFDGKKWKKIDFDAEMYFYDISGNKANGIAYAIARN